MRRGDRPDAAPPSFDDLRGPLALAVLAVHALAQTLQPFTRRVGTCGHRYFGVEAWAAWVVLGVFVAGTRPAPWNAEFRVVWYAIPALLVAHRAASHARRRRGAVCHSRYVGDSWARSLLPSAGASFCRGVVEPAAAVLAGALCLEWSPGVGGWLILAGAAEFLSEALLDARDERRAEQVEDARIESQALAERFRGRWGDG